MHLSLKGSMDRQPLTDRLGDKLLAEYGGAAAAYSLRSLSGDQTKVVRVRRSSDNAEKDFTASEMGAALEDWVNTDVTVYQSDFSSSTDGWSGSTASPVGNQDGVSDGTTSKDNVLKLTKNQDSQAYITRDQGVIAGLTYTVSGSFYAPSSNTAVDGILIKDGIAGSSLSDYPSGYLTASGVWTDFSFSYTATDSGSQRINMGISSLGSNPNGSAAGSTGDVVYIADLQFVETTSNGYVETWYDQSGNGNDATQTVTASQPKIVDAGTYLGEIDFDGSDDFIKMDSEVTLGTEFYVPMVVTAVSADSESNATFMGSDNSGGGDRLYLATSANLLAYRNNATNYTTSLTPSGTEAELVSYTATSSNMTTSLNGTDDVDAALAGSMGAEYIGGGTGFNLAASFKEIIIYNSDQSSNRTAIEANINNHYSIY